MFQQAVLRRQVTHSDRMLSGLLLLLLLLLPVFLSTTCVPIKHDGGHRERMVARVGVRTQSQPFKQQQHSSLEHHAWEHQPSSHSEGKQQATSNGSAAGG